MTHITYRLTAKNRDQLRNPTLRNRVWANFTFLSLSYLRRMSAGSMLAACLSWSFIQNGPWLIDAGCSTRLSTPPSDTASLNERRLCTGATTPSNIVYKLLFRRTIFLYKFIVYIVLDYVYCKLILYFATCKWPLALCCLINEINAVYIGWNDVTESMVTVRSPFCG